MEEQQIIELVRRKRLIFTVTTGRSGTAYLSTIFGYAQNTHCFHEPAPEYAKVLRQVQNGSTSARDFLIKEKLPAVLTDRAANYVETSHLTCKGFLEPLLDMGITPDLVIHRRAPRDVALSMFKMGTIPGRSDKGLMFYLSPADPDVLELSDWQSLHDYQLCYWYCLEIERRARLYMQIFKAHGARIAETTLIDLKTFSGLRKCFADLDLRLKFPIWLTRLRFLKSTGVKVNESKETKKEVNLPSDLTGLEQETVSKIGEQALQRWLPEMSDQLA